MSFKTIRQRISILKQFNFRLKEAKQAKKLFIKSASNGDHIEYNYYRMRYYWLIDTLFNLERRMSKTGGFGLVLNCIMLRKIAKIHEA